MCLVVCFVGVQGLGVWFQLNLQCYKFIGEADSLWSLASYEASVGLGIKHVLILCCLQQSGHLFNNQCRRPLRVALL